jgi:hypothetical protein
MAASRVKATTKGSGRSVSRKTVAIPKRTRWGMS